ncbi:MAG: hypothetical protein FWF83_05915 [Clostridiales bacterium]|nr:hypothetical protein [Clostridiales bacterium]
MPWVDILLVLIIALGALIGYNVGLLGAFKGFISKIAGLVCAWLLTPIAQAWLEAKWGAETFLAGIMERKLPSQVQEIISEAAHTAKTMQELREGLYRLFPDDLALYLQRTLNKAPTQSIPSSEAVIHAITREVAQCVLWAFLFILIWMIASIIVKGFMGMIFIGGDGKTIIGVLDGVLGMTAMTFIVVSSMIIFSGLIFPLILITHTEGDWVKIYPYLMDSRLIHWMGGIYQLYVVKWIGG